MPGPSTVAEYLAAVPNEARPLFEELRSTVRAELPDATEVVSYRILGLRQGKRIAVWYAAFADHCSLFPYTPALLAALGEELKPHLSGKGTLRFAVGEPLPVELVRRVARHLAAERSGQHR